MSDSGSAMLVERRERPALPAEPQLFEKLKELTRNGYTPDPAADPAADGLLLRHGSAPDLILFPDGRIELPVGQPLKRAAPAAEPAAVEAAPAPRRRRRIYKLRTLWVATLAVAIWLLSITITVLVVNG